MSGPFSRLKQFSIAFIHVIATTCFSRSARRLANPRRSTLVARRLLDGERRTLGRREEDLVRHRARRRASSNVRPWYVATARPMSTQKLQPFIAATWCCSSSCRPGSTPPGLPDRP
jgi:hypothetical protein